MSDLTLRVKRKRDEKPAEIIEIKTRKIKPESIDNVFSNLSIDSNKLVFKLQKNSFVKRAENFLKANDSENILQNIQENYISNHREQLKLQRLEKFADFRNKMIDVQISNETIFCNGKPMKSYNLGESENIEDFEYDLYKIEEINENEYTEGVLYLDSDGESMSSYEKSDSEDSNRENNPDHDYPEEEDSSCHSDYDKSDNSFDYNYEVIDY